MKKIDAKSSLKSINGFVKNHQIIFLIGVLVLAVYLASISSAAYLDDFTRADLSQHVSNMSCGPDYLNRSESMHGECPGELQCYRDLKDGRVGKNISGSRCVTPTFVERHCGIFESYFTEDSYPPSIGKCYGNDAPLYKYIPVLLNRNNSLDRIFNTDRNGTELIRSHGLELAVETEN